MLDDGEHLFQQLGMRDVPGPPDQRAMEIDLTPRVANTRGALQGGLIGVLVDVVAGRFAYESVPEGCSTATSDMTVHFLAPIVQGPARATARIVRHGRRTIVLQVEVTDEGRGRLAATSTIAFTILEPRDG